jgi:hypothetical protein
MVLKSDQLGYLFLATRKDLLGQSYPSDKGPFKHKQFKSKLQTREEIVVRFQIDSLVPGLSKAIKAERFTRSCS